MIVGAWAMTRGSATPAPESQAQLPAEVSVDEAYQKFEQGAFLLDVRELDEWNDHRIEGTTHIPLGELPSRVSELPKDEEIVVVCRSGNRSAEGRDILKAAGFEQVTSMDGGLQEWSAAGYPLFGNRP